MNDQSPDEQKQDNEPIKVGGDAPSSEERLPWPSGPETFELVNLDEVTGEVIRTFQRVYGPNRMTFHDSAVADLSLQRSKIRSTNSLPSMHSPSGTGDISGRSGDKGSAFIRRLVLAEVSEGGTIPANVRKTLKLLNIHDRERLPAYRRLKLRSDVEKTENRIVDEIESGRASIALLRSFTYHVESEARGEAVHARSFATPEDWPADLHPRLQRQVRHIDIEFLDTLGPHVSLAIIRGPTRTRIAVGLDGGFLELSELVFQVLRLFLHSVRSLKLRDARFAVALDYKQDVLEVEALKDILQQEDYRDGLGDAGVEAAAFMHPEYWSANIDRTMTAWLAHTGLAVVPRTHREHIAHAATHVRFNIHQHLQRGRGKKPHPTVATLLSSVEQQHPPTFIGNAVLARVEWWDRTYLLWCDESGGRHRWWVANREIQTCLGMHIQPTEREDLAKFALQGILLHPELVAAVKGAFKQGDNPAPEVDVAMRMFGEARSRKKLALEPAPDPR
jgi:hypothetical protein